MRLRSDFGTSTRKRASNRPGEISAGSESADVENGSNRSKRSTSGDQRMRAFPITIMLSLVMTGAFALFLLDEMVHLTARRDATQSSVSKGVAGTSTLQTWGERTRWLLGAMTGSQGARTPKGWRSGLGGPTSEIKHAFIWSDDKKFVAIDRYLVNVEGQHKLVVLGDGNIPLEFKGQGIVIPKFSCSMGDQVNKPARVVTMRGHKQMQQHYDINKQYPFSTNGDNFKSIIIYCDISSVRTAADAKNAPPLILSSDTGSFRIEIKSPIVLTGPDYAPEGVKNRGSPPPVGQVRPESSDYRVNLCLCPMYNVKSSRWLIEYLEYHLAAGIAHVHLYSYDDTHKMPLSRVLGRFSELGSVTAHDWTDAASQGFTQGHTYEHAKWTAMTDCLLRSRGSADFALFLDLDEVVFGAAADPNVEERGSILPAAAACHKQHLKSSKTKLGCSFNSHTLTSVYTKLTHDEEERESSQGTLLLERYSHEEAKPMCPYNCRCAQSTEDCRKFHYGRQKYMVYTGDMGIPPFVPWTHAIWRDYGLADKGMHILSDSQLHVRHYQGHWYQNTGKLATVVERASPLPSNILSFVKSQINEDQVLKETYDRYPGNGGLDWITPVDRPPKYHHSPSVSREENAATGLRRYECSANEAETQEMRIAKRFKEWWSHTACPDQVWMESFLELMTREVERSSESNENSIVVLDIGCNKGYTSADFFDTIYPAANMNAKTLHNAINTVARNQDTEYKRACGACGDCTRALNKEKTKNGKVDLHCFEPSPATYEMLREVDAILKVEEKSAHQAKWHIHNKGLHNKSGMLAWHKACNKVGDELCSIVALDTPDAIHVEVTTVDDFARKTLQSSGPIHMLKIDAEGLDPAVLRGATSTLSSHRAIYVMFEFNPGLRDKKPPYGMWGTAKGLTKLLEVTDWLDTLSYDCYLDSRVDGPKGVNAPPLYRITGNCVRTDPRILGWSNVICASRAFPEAAQSLFDLSVLVGNDGEWS